MTYLRVECHLCGAWWNFYEEKIEYPPILSTAIQYQGCVCPNCGALGFIFSYASGDCNELIKRLSNVAM